MPKRIVYTKITPLPSNVPRQLALDMLHSHGEIIELNPLVTGHKPIQAPRDASRDEFFAQWYEIEEVITWGLGMRKKISFKGVFHDMPWGLQTHIYAPMGVDLRNKYAIAGNEPGEPREVRELGIDAPTEGLYLREDVEIVCNIALASFVKKETKQTLLTMIERMTKKAELLDDGVLQAMFKGGKLVTRNPQVNQHAEKLSAPSTSTVNTTSSVSSSPGSPPLGTGDFAPNQTYARYSSLPGRMNTQRISQILPQELDAQPDPNAAAKPYNNTFEMEGSTMYITDTKSNTPGFTAELADTSMQYDPRRPSAQSYNSGGSLEPHNSSLQPTASFHSQRSQSSSYSNNAPAPLHPRPVSGDVPARMPSQSSYVITNPDQGSHSRAESVYSTASFDGQAAAPHASPPPPAFQGQAQLQPQQTPAQMYQAYSREAQPNAAVDNLAEQAGGLNISEQKRGSTNDGGNQRVMIKCPICGDFEGDSAAVSHHVNRSHFQ